MTPYAVYVIGPVQGWPCKVGIAANVQDRLMGIQTGSWEKLYIHEVFWAVSKSEALKIEKLCKRRLQQHCLSGEWFHVWTDDMIKELKEIISELKVTITEDDPYGLLIRKENYAGKVTYEYDIVDPGIW